MKSMIKIGLITAIFLAGALALSLEKVHAQQSNTVALSMTPPHAEMRLKPGKTFVLAFNIENEGSTDLDITPTLVDFTTDPATGEEILLPSSSFAYGDLQNLDKKFGQPFTLVAGQKDQLVFHVAIPDDAPDHEYYETLLLNAKPSTATTVDAAGSQTLASLGANIIMSVSGNGSDQGLLLLDRVKIPHIIDSFSTLSMQMFVKNTGKTFSKIEGQLRIRSAVTHNVDKVFPVLEENVLAGSVREAHASVQDPEDSKSSIPGEFTYHPLFLLGPYTVEFDLHAPNQTVQTYYGRVWALPISPTFVIITFLCIRFFLKKMSKHRDIPQLGA